MLILTVNARNQLVKQANQLNNQRNNQLKHSNHSPLRPMHLQRQSQRLIRHHSDLQHQAHQINDLLKQFIHVENVRNHILFQTVQNFWVLNRKLV